MEMDERQLLIAALLVYLPPLAGLLAGAGILPLLLPAAGELAAIAGGLGGFLLGLAAGRAWLRSRRDLCEPVICRRLEAGEACPVSDSLSA
jgi:positive regulator of sigma E activity